MAIAVGLVACGDSTGPKLSDVHGSYVLRDTLANGSWVHVTSGGLTLAEGHKFVMALPSATGPTGYQGDWELIPEYIALTSNRPPFFLQLVTSDMGQTSGAQIVVTDHELLAPGRASGSYAFAKQ